MRNISVVIAEEAEYAKKLAQYMMQHEPCIKPSWYVDKEGVKEHLCGKKADLVLLGMDFAEEEFLREIREVQEGSGIVLLTEETADKKYWDYPMIGKFQPADVILRQLYGILGEEAEDMTLRIGDRQELTGVFAPWNQELSMLFTRVFTKLLAKEQKMLSVTLQECYGMGYGDVMRQESNVMDVIEALRATPKNPGAVLRAALQTEDHIDYFFPADNSGNLLELTGEDYRILLDAIGEQLEQEHVVWEIPYLTDGCGEWISRCQKIYCPYQNEVFLPAMQEKLFHILGLYGLEEYEPKFRFFKIPVMHLTGASGISAEQLLWSEFGIYIQDQLNRAG